MADDTDTPPEPYTSLLPVGLNTLRKLFLMGVAATGASSVVLIFEFVLGVTRIETRFIVATVLCLFLSGTATRLAHRELKEAEARADARDRVRRELAQSNAKPSEWQPQGAPQPFAARPLHAMPPPPAGPPPGPGTLIGPDGDPQ